MSVVIEGGPGEKSVYKKWIPLVNSNLTYVEGISDIVSDNFAITAARGYPEYFNVIDSAVDDVNHFDDIHRLVIAVDSEEMSFQQKLQEVMDFLASKTCSVQIFIVIQHFCLETWALGNRRACRANPLAETLARYKRFFDVRQRDPELLPAYPRESLLRSQFAERYLRAMLNDRYRNLGYSKRNPRALLSPKYFDQIKKRFDTTGHIQSFSTFLDAFT